MAAEIEVTRIRDGEFQVVVVEGTSRSRHQVTLKESDYARLSGGKIQPEELIAKSFEFLLEHEPKEPSCRGSICSRLRVTSPASSATCGKRWGWNDVRSAVGFGLC